MDAGGTKTEVRLLSPHGLSLAVYRGPGFNGVRQPPEDLIRVLQEAFDVFRRDHRIEKISAVCVGAAGVFKTEEKKQLQQVIRRAFPSLEGVFVLSDAEVAFYTMFGDRPGVLLIAGTGSIALGRNEQGRWFRAGGLGLLLDDEGSGSWIGLEAAKAAIRARERRGPETALEERILGTLHPRDYLQTLREPYAEAFAALFPQVVQVARDGDDVARQIIDRAIQALLDSVEGVQRQMGTAVREFGYHGGLFREAWFRSRFVEAAEARSFRPQPLPEDPSMGAAKYALSFI